MKVAILLLVCVVSLTTAQTSGEDEDLTIMKRLHGGANRQAIRDILNRSNERNSKRRGTPDKEKNEAALSDVLAGIEERNSEFARRTPSPLNTPQTASVPPSPTTTTSRPTETTSTTPKVETDEVRVETPAPTTPRTTTTNAPTTAAPTTAAPTTTASTTTASTTTASTTTASTTTASTTTASATLTADQVRSIRVEFSNAYSRNSDMVRKMIQLGFHHCVGGCDGCIDLSSKHNKGLLSTYSTVRSMHSSFENVVSLADFIVIGSGEAIKVAASKDRNSINLPFKSGRKTCANPDIGKTQDLPSGEDRDAPRRILMGEFGLSENEMVALMGAHSIGAAHESVSGYRGDWDLTPDALENGYYKALELATWTTEFMPNAGATQWTSVSSTKLLMLHADMGLARDFTVSGPNHVPSCTSTCKDASTFRTVKNFADDVRSFLDTFSAAYQKMANHADFDASKVQTFP